MIKLFTYGILMDPFQMTVFLHRNIEGKPDRVLNYSTKNHSQLLFKTMFPCKKTSVKGVVYDISMSDLRRLDKVESQLYKKIKVKSVNSGYVTIYVENEAKEIRNGIIGNRRDNHSMSFGESLSNIVINEPAFIAPEGGHVTEVRVPETHLHIDDTPADVHIGTIPSSDIQVSPHIDTISSPFEEPGNDTPVSINIPDRDYGATGRTEPVRVEDSIDEEEAPNGEFIYSADSPTGIERVRRPHREYQVY